MHKHSSVDREKMSPQEAINLLIEGNERFINNETSQKDFQSLIESTKDKQHPFAAFVSCSDSRAPVELLFDQALGDIFSVRLAGNIASDKGIGSLEYACKYLDSRLIVVLGHTHCGAIKAACDNFRDGHIGEIINLIRPAMRQEKTVIENRNSSNEDFVAKVCELNVKTQIKQILHSSDIIQDLLAEHKVGLIGAIYDITSGNVTFLEDTLIL
ncbi:MAG: carbonic anhydrase [Methylophilaceae bacterium]|nr:MAG: carbonic anhydrase [Methylophilaceae bacterium]